jgi:thiamine biosynthesis lipoprotein
MATTFDLRVSCPEADAARAARALDRAHELAARLEAELSEFLEDSPVWRLNRARPFQTVRLTEAGMELLELSERMRVLTRGAFDPLAKSRPAPASEPGPRLRWDADTREAWRMDEGVRLGFGAIGKGYALDRVAQLLRLEGFADFLLSAGGSSIVLSGFAGPGHPWTFGWSWERDAAGEARGAVFSHWSGKPVAIGVSGTQEQGSHLLDPSTGCAPDEYPLASAFVALGSAAQADALSTAVFVRGIDGAREFLAELPTAAVAAIDRERAPLWNRAFQGAWGSVGLALLLTLPVAGIPLRPASAAAPAPKAPRPEVAEQQPKPVKAAPAPAGGEETVDLGGGSDESVDLGGEGSATASMAAAAADDSFNPYLFDRQGPWVLPAVFMFLMVLLHLKKSKPVSTRRKTQS